MQSLHTTDKYNQWYVQVLFCIFFIWITYNKYTREREALWYIFYKIINKNILKRTCNLSLVVLVGCWYAETAYSEGDSFGVGTTTNSISETAYTCLNGWDKFVGNMQFDACWLMDEFYVSWCCVYCWWIWCPDIVCLELFVLLTSGWLMFVLITKWMMSLR